MIRNTYDLDTLVNTLQPLNYLQKNQLSEDGNRTPLLIACRMGYPTLVRILVEAGANLELGNDTQGVKPLILAAYE